MARKRVAYRKNHQNRFSMFLVSLVVLFIVVAVSVRAVDLRKQREAYEAQVMQLDEQIQDEKDRAAEIEEYRKYTQTKKFVEEVAKEKLGLVYEDEVIFRMEE